MRLKLWEGVDLVGAFSVGDGRGVGVSVGAAVGEGVGDSDEGRADGDPDATAGKPSFGPLRHAPKPIPTISTTAIAAARLASTLGFKVKGVLARESGRARKESETKLAT
ncbi:MAG TPA: hypothetical protein VF337_01125 [Candidatus Limnocylindrales bacterium]